MVTWAPGVPRAVTKDWWPRLATCQAVTGSALLTGAEEKQRAACMCGRCAGPSLGQCRHSCTPRFALVFSLPWPSRLGLLQVTVCGGQARSCCCSCPRPQCLAALGKRRGCKPGCFLCSQSARGHNGRKKSAAGALCGFSVSPRVCRLYSRVQSAQLCLLLMCLVFCCAMPLLCR